MMARVACTEQPATPCPHLDRQCTAVGEHDIHWGPDNTVAAIRPDQAIQPLVSAMLCSFEEADPALPPTAPRLAVSFDHFDGDLTLAELDQLIAGLRDFTRQLQIQAAHLAAAQRLHEVTQ